MLLHSKAHLILITKPSLCLTLPAASMPGAVEVTLSMHLYLPVPECGIAIAKCQYIEDQYIEDLISCKLSRTRPRSRTSTYLNKGSQGKMGQQRSHGTGLREGPPEVLLTSNVVPREG